MTSSLKLVITFRKCMHDPVYVEKFAYYFFDKLMREEFQDESYEYNVSIQDAKNIDIENVYNADVYETEVSLDYSFGHTTTEPLVYGVIFSKIIQVWSNSNKNTLSHLWLRIANPSVLENSGKLHHSDVEIKEIAFGSLPDMQHFVYHYHYVSNSLEKEISCSFLHSQRKLMMYTCFTHLKSCPESENPIHNKFQFNYESIARVIINYVGGTDLVQIFFHLHYTPFLYVKKTAKNKRMQAAKMNESTASVSFLASDQEYQALTWERTLDFGCKCKKFLCNVERIGRCRVFKVVIPKKHKTYDIIERLIQRCSSNTLFHFTNIKTVFCKKTLKDFQQFPFNEEILKLLLPDHYLINEIKFKCQFAWEVLLCRSLEIEDQISLKYKYKPDGYHSERLRNKIKSFMNVSVAPFSLPEICDMLNKVIDALSKSLYDISEMINKNLIFTFEDAMGKLFNHHLMSINDEEVPDGMCLVRRVILTPSKIICLPPTEHFDNRVIRSFETDHFLRISIQDDNFQKLTFAVQHNSKRREFLRRVIADILLDGIFIGPRKYEILAASNSQLREHGLWMYSRDQNGVTAQKIREWMGNFEHIRNVAKYMARMGQCFSTSDEAVQIELKENEVIELSDIEKRRPDGGKYVFSDGVGMISKDLAEEVRRAFSERHNPHSVGDTDVYDPSAFQIRFQGCKGMLAEVDSRMLSGREIGIRPSMKKFDCDSSNALEIVKISAPRAVFLNRPLITILENLGIEPSVFLELQKKMVFDLTDSLIYEKKARKMLENCTSLSFPFKKLNENGISLTQEPFYRSLLLCVYKSIIGNLKRKARIAISPRYGRNMMGVIDETKTLKYGQIFAQYSKQVGNIKSPTKILTETVVVTKNPCMHPGDVRKFEAVDVPALHHIKDCIVFPAVGKRPHPDEMAGSDLDGDEYVLIWDPALKFPVDNHDAMDYPANTEELLDGPIQVEDMVDFICQYIQHDNIGLMANAYLAWADYNIEGILSDVCMKIAQKYPQALDFAKSGTTTYLESSERPKFYPDFMEKGCQNNSYKSEKSLGLLYRVIRNLEASVSNISNKVSVIPDHSLEYGGWEEFKNLAKQRKDQYTKRVKNILQKYGMQNEAEGLTGYVSEISECNKNKYDSENVVLLSKKYLFDTMKRYHMKFINDCEEAASNNRSLPRREIKYMMASAWYMVTYQDYETTVLSFPWVVADLLCEIRLKNTPGRISISESMFIDSFDAFLNSTFKEQLNMINKGYVCYCVIVLHHTMADWIKKSAFILTMSTNDVFCHECFNRIIAKFRSKMPCCSGSRYNCHCAKSCSPMKFILECFKFYASDVIPDIGSCGSNIQNGVYCDGFRILNLQSLALKTYAVIAITQNMYYLGLMENNIDTNDSGNCEEGDPIRIKVTEDFEDILTGRVDEVCKILRDLSGVKQVFIDGSSDRNAYYILVQSIGKAFSRWNLEELIMDSECPNIIKARLT